jgi:hypothetical protein
VVGVAEKAAGDRIRIPIDFGNEDLLIQGYTIASYDVTCSDVGAPTISGKQLDYPFQLSAVFSAGTPGTYSVVYSIVLNDVDASAIVRTATLQVY